MFQNENFQFSKCRLQQVRNKFLHNLKVSMFCFAIMFWQYVFGQAIQVSNDCTSTVEQILQYLPYEALLEPGV